MGCECAFSKRLIMSPKIKKSTFNIKPLGVLAFMPCGIHPYFTPFLKNPHALFCSHIQEIFLGEVANLSIREFLGVSENTRVPLFRACLELKN